MDAAALLYASADGALRSLGPQVLWIVGTMFVLLAILRFPMLRRGPDSSFRDPWRTFRFAARERVMARAGGRCEGSLLLAWGRCRKAGTEVDHIMPWSKAGPTVVSNAQLLCHAHNRDKGSRFPSWWAVMSLERRRRSYFPADESPVVLAVLNDGDRRARERWLAQRAA